MTWLVGPHFESLLVLELHRKRAKNVAMMGRNMHYRDSWLEDLVEGPNITCSAGLVCYMTGQSGTVFPFRAGYMVL